MVTEIKFPNKNSESSDAPSQALAKSSQAAEKLLKKRVLLRFFKALITLDGASSFALKMSFAKP